MSDSGLLLRFKVFSARAARPFVARTGSRMLALVFEMKDSELFSKTILPWSYSMRIVVSKSANFTGSTLRMSS